MARSTVQMFFDFVLFVVINNLTIANPISSGSQARYEVYADLVCETDRLWKWGNKLFLDFKSDRLPNTEDVRAVNVPNLLLTDDMGILQRRRASDIDLLTDHREYFWRYKYIIAFVLEDEKNATSATNFVSEIQDILLSIKLTIAKIENVMLHLDLNNLPETETDISEGMRPYFDPKWQMNVVARYERDLFVLQQITAHLTKAYQDFSARRDLYIQVDTTPMNCPHVLPS